MSSRRWNLGIAILLILFAWLLLQFLFSTLRIRELVGLESRPTDRDASPHVVLIAQEIDNPFWRTIEQGAREASDKFGYRLEYTGPFRINPDEQIRLLEKAIAAKVDAVLVQGINDPQHRMLIDKAIDQGIQVITVDADEPDSKRLSYIGTDNLSAGKTMGELVVKSAGGKGSIGVIIANEKAYSQQQRLNGFRSVIGRYPEMSIVEVRASNISRLQAEQQAAEIIGKYPQVGYMVGFSSLDGPGILKAAERVRPHGLKIFAFDDQAETMEAVTQRRIESTIVQQPYEMGYRAVSMLVDAFQGKKPAQPNFTETKIVKSMP